jgi:hypothetical protein
LLALEELLFTAQKLFNEGNYSQAIEEYGKVMELIFMELYREYFPQLAYSEKEKVLNYEKSIGKAPEKFTLGEWVGLFRQTRFSDFIKNKKGITGDSLFFSYGIIDALVNIRNRVTHPGEDRSLDRYDKRNVASFMESAILCVLQELGIGSATIFQPPIAASLMRGQRGKQFAEVSREDILRASRNPRIKDFRYVWKYVLIDGKRYPVKGLLSIASGVPTSKFTTNEAERILEKLGFRVMHAERI